MEKKKSYLSPELFRYEISADFICMSNPAQTEEFIDAGDVQW